MEQQVSRKFLTEQFPNGSAEMTDEQLQEYISTRKLPIVSSLTNEQILTLIRQLGQLMQDNYSARTVLVDLSDTTEAPLEET